ncbi:hybrid sensor histidine kinase/response regulator transcription factor [Bacteroides sp. 51]|uniref:hybrid sensor histidine kinase/response regulator transcription factor n=1 Tax=Bacteroides sp. 51 TaxID=2302938 RepID=UPI0013D76431|nr:hybrid sensor histidine kinase/response regulator transcription factor [Bacteroides sp. 51]NDV82516.1 hybrid sensor histidine kinase/response regulator [Bacteroides sp. 51]
MKHLLIFLLLSLINIPLYAQHIVAKQMPFFHELSSNEIWDVGQDKEGYLWISTTNGLARYDGYKLQFFRSDYKYPGLLTNNSIICISDNGPYIWIGTRKGVNLFEKKTCKIFPFPDAFLLDKEVNNITVDQDNYTWIAAEGKLYKCTPDARIIKEYPIASQQSQDRLLVINSVYVDKSNQIWVMAYGSGPLKYDVPTDSFVAYPQFSENSNSFIMYQDSSSNYWMGTWGEGLWQFFPEETGAQCYKKHRILNTRTGQDEPLIYSMTQDDTFGYLWILSYNELYALNLTTDGTLEQVDIHDLVDTHMMYTRIFKDRDGNLWLSSYDMAYTIFFDDSKTDNYPLPQLKERLGWDANLLNLCKDEGNIIWMCQDRYGLCLYDMSGDKLSYNDIHNYSGTLETLIMEKALSKRGVWASDRNNLRVMRLSQQNMKIYIEEDIYLNTFVSNPGSVEQLVEDHQGNLWIITSTMLLVKPANSQKLIVASQDLPRMSRLAVDGNGKVWGISVDKTICTLNYSANTIASEQKVYIPNLSEQELISYVCMDKKECLWMISTLGRIYKSDKEKQTFESMPLENNIEDCSVLSMLADENCVWISTNKRIIQYNIDHKTVRNYSTSDGNILVNVFRHKAIGLDGEGGLYVGGHGGFIHIQSGAASVFGGNHYHPVVTDIKVENRSVFFSDICRNGDHTNTIEQITLQPGDRNIEISFSSLSYSLNPKTRIAYMLEGIDKDWVYPEPGKHAAFYNRIPKGTYRFRLKSEYEQGKWTDSEVLLTIEQYPAFYETWYAYLFYVLLIGLCIYLILHTYSQRIKRKNSIKFREELNRTKLDYFTNVSHELLTPLTVISTATDHLEAKDAPGQKQTLILRSNVDKLKRLIQQILDFRKMDMGRMTLSVSYGSIKDFIIDICRTNFLPLARKKNIDLQINVDTHELYGYIDFDKLDKILYNLLSNAIKYTPENKQIRVIAQLIQQEDGNCLVIKVEDDGIGISHKEIDHIFTRFYSNRKNKGIESNGIGLSLTKDLVTLHHGTITVVSVPDKGTCFTVELPVDKESYTTEERLDEMIIEGQEDIFTDEIPSNDLETTEETDRFTILLVDDNTELLYVMKGIFKNKYNVVTATNGQQAWEILNNTAVDVAICDVMMPNMNGWELCNRIKTDLRFNHIPVIILTAKKGIDDRVASYEAGADGYIAKPFESKVLFARVDNLLKSYKMRQTAFQKEEDINLEGLNYQSADKQFLQSIIDSIEQHLEEPEFDLEQLSSDLNMSRSTLYRKIKSMTGLTPLDFIHNIKMKRACMMLHNQQMNISEVAYAVGFSNPKYFSKRFKDEFGITPSEFQARL